MLNASASRPYRLPHRHKDARSADPVDRGSAFEWQWSSRSTWGRASTCLRFESQSSVLLSMPQRLLRRAGD